MKKFLSLVLALTMALSLAVVGASATAYSDLTDKSAITHTAAVEAMNELGIITGYTDGSFQPEGGLNRAEAAKIICYIMMGSTAADKLTTTTTIFSDVPTSHWAAAYINYCANLGVIDGYGNGKYGPYDKVTGYQFAKMLLSAVGYNANNNLVGDGWRINTAKLALTLGMLGDETADCSDAVLSRDSACLYAFNTLKGIDIVTYNRGTDGYTSTGATYGQQTYGMLSVTGSDSQGNPGTTYTSRIFPDFKVFQADGNIKTYTSKLTTVPSLGLGSYAFETSKYTSTVASPNSTKGTTYTTNTLTDVTATVTGARLIINGVVQKDTFNGYTVDYRVNSPAEILALTGNGVKVSVYLNSSNQISLITVTRSYLAEVTSVNTATKQVTYRVFDGVSGVAAINTTIGSTVWNKAATMGVKAPTANPQTSFISDAGFGSVAVKDMVMVTPVYDATQTTWDYMGLDNASATVPVYLTAAASIDSVYAATKVAGIASAKTAATVTIGGTVYSAATDASEETGTTINELLLTGAADATAYLDQYGYLFSVSSGSVATNWLYLIDTVSVSVSGVGYNVMGIRAILSDGTSATYPLINAAGAYYPASTYWNSNENSALCGAYKYSLTNGAVYLKALSAETTNTTLVVDPNGTLATAGELSSYYVAPTAVGSDTKKGDAKIGTVYAASGMSTIFMGDLTAAGVYNSVTYATKATATGVQTMATADTACVVKDAAGNIAYVFYMGSSASGSVYLTKVTSVNNIANDAGFDSTYYGVFTGYVDGVQGTYKIKLDTKNQTTAWTTAKSMLYSFYTTYAAEGYASKDVLVAAVDAKAAPATGNNYTGAVNLIMTAGSNTTYGTATGSLKVGGTYLNDGTTDFAMSSAAVVYVGEQNTANNYANNGDSSTAEHSMTTETLYQYIYSYNYAMKVTALVNKGVVTALYINNWNDGTYVAG